VFHLGGHRPRWRFRSISRQNLGREAGAFNGHRVEEVRRLDRLPGRHRGVGPRDRAEDAWGYKNAVPEPVVAGTERSPQVLDDLGGVRAVLGKKRLDTRIVLLEQGE